MGNVGILGGDRFGDHTDAYRLFLDWPRLGNVWVVASFSGPYAEEPAELAARVVE
jgi:hypothetical protein